MAYSLGNLGKAIVLTSFDTCLLYYLVAMAGFGPLLAGGLLTAVMVWDALADVAVAYWADRHGRASALGRLIVLGAPLCGISFWLIFAASPAQSPALVLGSVVLCRVGFTLCDIGHNTLLVRIAATSRDAAIVSGLRLIFSSLGAGMVGLAVRAIFSGAAGHQQAGFAPAAMAGGAFYIMTLLIAHHATSQLRGVAAGRAPVRAGSAFGALRNDRAYRAMLYLIAIQAGLIPLFNRALPFVGAAKHGGAGWAGTAITVITLAQGLSLPVWMRLTRTASSAVILALAYGAMLLALAMLTVQSGGWFGLTGLALMGVAQGGMNLAIWALLATSVRREGHAGSGNEALPVGLFLSVLKGSAGGANALLAISIAIGTRWCAGCSGHDSAPMIFAATMLPVAGCAGALLLLVRNWQALAPDAGMQDGR